MFRRYRFALSVGAVATIVFALAALVDAQVVNPSFELPDIGNNTFAGGSFTGWTATNASAGVQDFGTATPVPTDGSQHAFVNGTGAGSGTLHQTLVTPIVNGQRYTLTVDVGQVNAFSGSQGTFRLFGSTSGFTVPLSNANGSAQLTGIAPASGTYLLNQTVQYTALPAGDPFAGQQIGIALVGGSGTQVIFDNVRFTVADLYYWDNNGATVGFGAASGTWAAPTTNNGTQGWSRDPLGATLPTGTTTTDSASSVNFGTATHGLGAGTVSVSGAVSVDNITFGAASGAILISGGTSITLGGTTPTITVNNSTNTISTAIAGSAGLTKAGSGTLTLSGANTFTGLVTVSAGVLEFKTIANGSASSLGTGSGSSPNGRIVIGNGDLKFTGTTTQTVDRNIAWQSGATGALDASGAPGAALVINDTAANPFNNAGARTFTFGGTNTDANTYSGVLANQAANLSSVTKTGTGNWVLSGANTYTGTTLVSGGTLDLTGNRTAASGSIEVRTGGTLGISNGNFSIGNNMFFVGADSGTSVVHHTGGTISTGTGGNQVLIGNDRPGIYNLSGGTLAIGFTGTAGTRGVMLGVNTNGAGTFNLSGTGHLNMTAANSGLQIGRSDSVANNTTNAFNQTGGTATIRHLRIGGSAGGNSGVNSTLNLTGGTFTAAVFDRLAHGNTNTALIHIGGTADVTLPAFPTAALGAGSTATITFDGGTLRNLAASADYLGNISSAQIMAGGAKFNTAGGNITITHDLLSHGSSLGGGLTKEGANTLTLSGTNSYTGNTTVSGGSLFITNAANTTPGVFIIQAGSTLNLASFSDYGVASAMGNRLASSETNSATDSATSGIGLHFRGGTLQYTGSTAQSTNRQIRMLNGNGATIDASGSNPAATLSFTHSGANTNLFDNPGTRTLTLTGSNTGENLFAIRLENQGSNRTSLVKSGVGTWALSGASTYGGATDIQAGILRIQNNTALGAGGFLSTTWTLVKNNATLQFDGNLNVNEHTHIQGAGAGGIGALHALSGSSTLTENVALDANASIGAAAGATLNIAAIIYDQLPGSFGITKVGDGTLILSGNNIYTGTTTINDGALLQNGNYTGGGDFIVNTGGRLGGSGTANGDLIVDGGTVAPGTSIESLGQFASMTFNGGQFEYELNTASLAADLLYGGDLSTLSLDDPVLTLIDLATSNSLVPLGTKFTLIAYDGAWDGGIFQGYADDSLFEFAGNNWLINYNDFTPGGNFQSDALANGTAFVTITAVPEPSMWTAALAGMFALIVVAWRQRGQRRLAHARNA